MVTRAVCTYPFAPVYTRKVLRKQFFLVNLGFNLGGPQRQVHIVQLAFTFIGGLKQGLHTLDVLLAELRTVSMSTEMDEMSLKHCAV